MNLLFIDRFVLISHVGNVWTYREMTDEEYEKAYQERLKVLELMSIAA